MKSTHRAVLWMIVGVLIVIGTYLVFDATHAFYEASLTGERYFKEGRYSAALPYLLDAYHMKPLDKNVAWKLVWTYEHLNRESEGRRLLEEINTKSTADPKVSESLGDMAFSENAYVLAQGYYERVLAKKPLAALVRKKYAETLLGQKKYADALGQMDILLAQHPDDKSLHLEHAKVVAALGDHERAARELRVLVNEGYGDKEAITILGDQLRLSGKDEEAIKMYKEVENGQ
jgi:tetratricopeptide (TPR) repeat protein